MNQIDNISETNINESVVLSFAECDKMSKSDEKEDLAWEDGFLTESFCSEKPYEEEQMYDLFFMNLPWRKFTLDLTEENPEDYVVLLLCANRTGTRRTRVLVVAQQDRLKPLKGIHPLSQPVLYTDHKLDNELLADWFHNEFVPANSDEFLPCLLTCTENIECDDDFLSYDGKDTLRFETSFPEDRDRCLKDVRNVIRVRYSLYLLETYAQHKYQFDDLEFNEFLTNHFNLKSAFSLIHRSWMQTDVKITTDFEETLCELTNQLTHAIRMLDLKDTQLSTKTLSEFIKVEDNSDCVSDTEEPPEISNLTASDAASLLETASLWMESQPIEPAIIMGLRQIAGHLRKACFQYSFIYFTTHSLIILMKIQRLII